MLIGGVLGYVFREKLLSTVDREMKSSLRLYDHRKSIRDAWDTTQSTVSYFAVCYQTLSNFFSLQSANPHITMTGTEIKIPRNLCMVWHFYL